MTVSATRCRSALPADLFNVDCHWQHRGVVVPGQEPRMAPVGQASRSGGGMPQLALTAVQAACLCSPGALALTMRFDCRPLAASMAAHMAQHPLRAGDTHVVRQPDIACIQPSPPQRSSRVSRSRCCNRILHPRAAKVPAFEIGCHATPGWPHTARPSITYLWRSSVHESAAPVLPARLRSASIAMPRSCGGTRRWGQDMRAD